LNKNMEIAQLTDKDLETIRPLILNYRFNDYRNYRIFTKEVATSYLMKQITDLVAEHAPVFILTEKSKVIALCALKELPIESEIFGFTMAKLEYLITDASYAEEIRIKNAIILFIIQFCKNKKIAHLSCRIDTSDFSAIHSLEAGGFILTDTLVTYGFNSNKYTLAAIKDFWTVRKFENGDLENLMDIARDAFFDTRFYIDLHTRKKAGEFYTEWAKRSCQGRWADCIFVAERKGKIIGFATYKLDEKLYNFSGIKILGRGLIATVPNIMGVFATLLKALIREGKEIFRTDDAEFETQINKFSVIKTYQRFGLQMLRAKHAFHKWLE